MTLLTVLIFLMMLAVTFLFTRRQLETLPRFHSYSANLSKKTPLIQESPVPKTAETMEKAEETPITPAVKEEAAAPPLPQAISRFVVDKHTVEWGECFSLITGEYWDDMFLWPDLYLLNDMKSGDPDLIYPNEVVEIFNRLGENDTYTGRERETILQAYIDVYRIYKNLGEE